MPATTLSVLLASLIGCSDDDRVHHLPPAPDPTISVAPDSYFPSRSPVEDGDPPLQSDVAIHVTNGGIDTSAIVVYFHAADGSMIHATATDALGSASQIVPAGSAVTIVDDDAMVVRTWANVQPGDRLAIDLAEPDRAERVAEVAFTQHDLAVDYTFTISNCGVKVLGGDSLVDTTGCPAVADVMVGAYDDDGALFASYVVRDVALANPHLDLPGTYLPVPAARAIALADVPASASSLAIQEMPRTARGTLWNDFESIDPGAGSSMIHPIAPAMTGAVTVDRVVSSGAFGRRTLTQWGAAPSSLSLGAMTKGFASPPVLEVSSRTITWTPTADGADAGFAMVSIATSNENLGAFDWRVMTPWTAGAVALPKLPAELADYDLENADTAEPLAIIIGSDAVVAREHAFDATFDPTEPGLSPSGARATATWTAAYPPGTTVTPN